MAKFKMDTNAIMKQIQQSASKEIRNMRFDSTCPHCKARIKVTSGMNKCPFCLKQIDVDFNINYTK